MQCAVPLPRIAELNPHLICILCGGYYIDATTIVECLHAFCKSCIVRYLETNKYCPICDVLVHKSQPLQNIRPDKTRQSIVYKLIPNLYKREMRNRRNFYFLVQPQLRPPNGELSGQMTEASTFFSADDTINLSLEYLHSLAATMDQNYVLMKRRGRRAQNVRYFKCEAAVTVESLRKLLAAKYDVRTGHEIRFFLQGIRLPEHFKLLDVAYIASWKRVGYIRLFFEILIEQKQKREPEHTRNLIQVEDKTESTSNAQDVSMVNRTSRKPNTNDENKKTCEAIKQFGPIIKNETPLMNAFEEENGDNDQGEPSPTTMSTQCTFSKPISIINSSTVTFVTSASSANSKRNEDFCSHKLMETAASHLMHTEHETVKSTNEVERHGSGTIPTNRDKEQTSKKVATITAATGSFVETQKNQPDKRAMCSNIGEANYKRKLDEDDDKPQNLFHRRDTIIQNAKQSSTNEAGPISSRNTETTMTAVTLPTIKRTTKTLKLTAKAWSKCAFTSPTTVPVEIQEATKWAKMFKTRDTPHSLLNQTTSKVRSIGTSITTTTVTSTPITATTTMITTTGRSSKTEVTGNSTISTSVIKINPKTLSPIVTLPFSNSGSATIANTTSMSASRGTMIRNVSEECSVRSTASSTNKSFATFLDAYTTTGISSRRIGASTIAGSQPYPNLQPSSLLPMNQLMRRLFSNLDAESQLRLKGNNNCSKSKTATSVHNLYQRKMTAVASVYNSHRHYQRSHQSLRAYKYSDREPTMCSSFSSPSSLSDKRIRSQKGENEMVLSKTQSSSVRRSAAVENNFSSRMESSSSKSPQQQGIQDSDDNVTKPIWQRDVNDSIGKNDDDEMANANEIGKTRAIVQEKVKSAAAEISEFCINNLIASDESKWSKFHRCSAVEGVEECDQINMNRSKNETDNNPFSSRNSSSNGVSGDDGEFRIDNR